MPVYIEREREFLGPGLATLQLAVQVLRGGGGAGRDKNTGFQIRAAKVVFFGQVFFFPLYIANRILHIYLDPRGTSFACLRGWV